MEKFKKIKSIKEMDKRKINVLCLRSKNIEECFMSIFDNKEFEKPLELSEKIWNEEGIMKKIKNSYYKDKKQIYEIIEKIVSDFNS